MSTSLFTSESVSRGHPDKVADQISDYILDTCLQQDPRSKVACETLISKDLVVVGGEITTTAQIDYRECVAHVLREIGYDDPALGFDYHKFRLLVSVNEQSPDIAQGVEAEQGLFAGQGAGDQGMMFGYACNETPEFMPLPIMLAQKMISHLDVLRTSKRLPYLRPDAKCQVTVEYDALSNPLRVHTVVLSTQHDESVEHEQIVKDIKEMAVDVILPKYLDEETLFFVNPTGRFVTGGPAADCGLTGRKIVVDTYGGMARHGGGCFSGKDPSKVDRSAAYAVRYVAKNVVAAGLASRCEVQVAYAIGVPQPVSIKVETFGSGVVEEQVITEVIREVFDLSPKGIAEMLNLTSVSYFKSSFGGHFGRLDENFTWERMDRMDTLRSTLKQKSSDSEYAKTALSHFKLDQSTQG